MQRRSGKGFQDVGYGTDMIFMSMGIKNSEYIELQVKQGSEIWQDEIDARHIVGGEHDARIDDDGFVAIGKTGHIFTNFTEATDGYDV